MPEPRRVNKKEYRAQRKHPYSLEEIIRFYQACHGIYLYILHTRPDLIVAPLRGSRPIIKTVQLIASLEKNSSAIPRVIYPRTGEQHSVKSKGVHDSMPPKFVEAMTNAQKKKELAGMIGPYVPTSPKGKPFSIVLVDEAFSGGSITEHYEAIQDLARRRNWRVQVHGLSVKTKHQKVSTDGSYKRHVHAGHIKEFEVPWLFITDSPKFLQPLLGTKRDFLQWIRKSINRPRLGLSRQALDGLHEMYSDIQAIHAQRVTAKTTQRRLNFNQFLRSGRLGRLPMRKPR